MKNEDMVKEMNESTIIKSDWYTVFKEDMEKTGDKNVLKVISMLDNAYDNETRENIQEIEFAIESLKGNVAKTIINKLNRKLRVMQNRTERAIEDNFGSIIRYLREKKEYSLKDLENITGISASYIHRMEKGERKAPSYPIIEKLANALEVEMSMLLKIADIEKEKEMLSFGALVLSNNCTIGDNELTKKQKELIVEIVEKISSVEWDKNKYKETLEIVDLIDQYKSIKE
ncbi:MAG: putative transcriptional regulator [Clostridiaceae bacterium]|nr:putative transcriptional regulator [Clostridiaceae bacterium]